MKCVRLVKGLASLLKKTHKCVKDRIFVCRKKNNDFIEKSLDLEHVGIEKMYKMKPIKLKLVHTLICRKVKTVKISCAFTIEIMKPDRIHYAMKS
jgi:hypothetical protein